MAGVPHPPLQQDCASPLPLQGVLKGQESIEPGVADSSWSEKEAEPPLSFLSIAYKNYAQTTNICDLELFCLPCV